MSFIPRFVCGGRDSFFLLGPRGTGKTFWCGHECPDALRVDLLNPAVLRRYSATPEYLIELLEENAKAKHLVIDEIKKLWALLEVVHLLLERKTGAQFILTGSSARKLRRQGVNLLGGRATQRLMHP
jgi:predicted AAA+ superfamily ATPase